MWAEYVEQSFFFLSNLGDEYMYMSIPEFPEQMASNAGNVSFDDVIMKRFNSTSIWLE